MTNMNLSELLKSILGGEADVALSLGRMVFLFGNSLVMGILLTLITFISSSLLDPEFKEKNLKKILGVSNNLFLCVGLTGVLILVNHNFTRAIAIGATLGLMRFRVNINDKRLASNLLFAIIVGVACGLGELQVAWLVTGLYLILKMLLIGVVKIYLNHDGGHKNSHLTAKNDVEKTEDC